MLSPLILQPGGSISCNAAIVKWDILSHYDGIFLKYHQKVQRKINRRQKGEVTSFGVVLKLRLQIFAEMTEEESKGHNNKTPIPSIWNRKRVSQQEKEIEQIVRGCS